MEKVAEQQGNKVCCCVAAMGVEGLLLRCCSTGDDAMSRRMRDEQGTAAVLLEGLSQESSALSQMSFSSYSLACCAKNRYGERDGLCDASGELGCATAMEGEEMESERGALIAASDG